MSTTDLPRFCSFDRFRIDTVRRLLWSDGNVLPIPPKAFETLLVLVRHRGRVVSKDDLMRLVWQDASVEENNLSQNISLLRKTLGEKRDSHRYLVTIPGKGYCFVGEVIEEPPSQPPSASELQEEKARTEKEFTASSKLARARAWLIAIGTIVLVLSIAYFFRPALPPPRVSGYTQITHDGQQKSFDGEVIATVLTDGPRIYVQENVDGRFVVAQVSASGGETVPISTPLPNVALYGISPDGAELLVGSFERTEENLGLWTIPLLGGSPRSLGLSAADATWMPNGDLLFSHDNHLYVQAKGTQSTRPFLGVSGLPYWLRWSPDGSVLRFTVQGGGALRPSLWEASADGSRVHPMVLNSGIANVSRGCWSPDGKYFVFQARGANGPDIWAAREKGDWFHKVSHQPLRLTAGPLQFRSPQVSADGKRIFVVGILQRAE